MAVRIDLLIDLPDLAALKLVGGFKGTYRTVRWVHIIETTEVVSYVQNDELIILTGVAINNEASFVELVHGLIKRNAAGLIVNIGKYFSKIPDCVLKIGEDNDFPIFELPWEISIADVTKTICETIVKRQLEELAYQDLLMNIIFFNKISYEDFKERMSAHGYSSLHSYRIAIVEIDRFQNYIVSKGLKNEQEIANLKDSFLRTVNSVTTDSIHYPISFFQNDSVVILLVNEESRFMNLSSIAHSVIESVKRSFSDITVNIAFGNIYPEFSKIPVSYKEAEKTLKAMEAEGYKERVGFYSDIGAYKLITEIKDMDLIKEYYDQTVGVLEQYDAWNETDYAKIFYVFLQENGNYIQTAKRLYLHRNTLVYKINKIQEILKLDITDVKVRFEFYLGYLLQSIHGLKHD
ncbi:MAG: PucR family transcriptional regulator [Desulfitobacteriia bacterium]